MPRHDDEEQRRRDEASRLGWLSRQNEGGGPRTVSPPSDDPGGISYGSYQLRSSRVWDFLHHEGQEFADRFKHTNPRTGHTENLRPGSEAFTNAWREVAGASEHRSDLMAAEDAYIKRTHYDVQAEQLQRATGLDLNSRSETLRQVVYSTSVQFGPNTTCVQRGLEQAAQKAGTDIAHLTDKQMKDGIYAERDRTHPNGQMVHFPDSPGQWQGLHNRFHRESQQADGMLAREADGRDPNVDARHSQHQPEPRVEKVVHAVLLHRTEPPKLDGGLDGPRSEPTVQTEVHDAPLLQPEAPRLDGGLDEPARTSPDSEPTLQMEDSNTVLPRSEPPKLEGGLDAPTQVEPARPKEKDPLDDLAATLRGPTF
jgi:hypothetical protein